MYDPCFKTKTPKTEMAKDIQLWLV